MLQTVVFANKLWNIKVPGVSLVHYPTFYFEKFNIFPILNDNMNLSPRISDHKLGHLFTSSRATQWSHGIFLSANLKCLFLFYEELKQRKRAPLGEKRFNSLLHIIIERPGNRLSGPCPSNP